MTTLKKGTERGFRSAAEELAYIEAMHQGGCDRNDPEIWKHFRNRMVTLTGSTAAVSPEKPGSLSRHDAPRSISSENRRGTRTTR